jgi:Na+/H+ antiporter 1
VSQSPEVPDERVLQHASALHEEAEINSVVRHLHVRILRIGPLEPAGGARSTLPPALYWWHAHLSFQQVKNSRARKYSPRDLGLFDPREDLLVDTLNQFEHWSATPVQFVLLLFGVANAGVPFEQVGPGTYFVLASLLVGKPVGILLFSGAARLAGASLPARLHLVDLVVVGITAAIGFTVSLFFATAAFPAGAALAETKMGALLSFSAAPLAVIASRLWRGRGASDLGPAAPD